MLVNNEDFEELRATYYDERGREELVKGLVRRLTNLGYEVIKKTIIPRVTLKNLVLKLAFTVTRHFQILDGALGGTQVPRVVAVAVALPLFGMLAPRRHH